MTGVKFFLPIPNDEIPISTVARYSLLSGYRPPQAMKQIFGNSKKRLHPYLPGLVEKFAEFFGLNAERVINEKTIYPLLRFAQPNDIAKIKNVMLNQTDDKVILNTAIAHSRFRLFYGLNYCPQCVEADTNKFGFSYWHITHQIPGVQICHLHNILLHSIPMGDGNRDRTLFLPPDATIEQLPVTQAQIKLAQFTSQLFSLCQVENLNYRQCYQHLLIAKGLQNPTSGGLKMANIVNLLSEYWRELQFTDHLKAGVPKYL